MAIRVLSPKGLGQPLGMYSHGVEARGLVVVAGQVGLTSDGRLAGADVGAQTKQALANIAAILAAAGCSMQDVIRLQTFLVSADDIPGFMTARSEVFPAYFPKGAYPPNTLLVVSRLVKPELNVEIEALAVRPARSRPAARGARGRGPAARRARPRRR